MGEVDNGVTAIDDYRIDFNEVAGVMQFTVTNVTNPAANPMPGVTGVPYEAGKTVSFGGVSLQMNGVPATGDQIVLEQAQQTDIFSVVRNAVDALRYTGANDSAHRTQELARTMTELDAGHDRVLLARGRAGEWLNRADSLDALMEDRSVDLKAEKSRLEDLDLVQGISDFKSMELGLEAALKSYAQVQRLSLFQVIN
ncbi:flagellar hook-associated protein 3 [compost metagenome]